MKHKLLILTLCLLSCVIEKAQAQFISITCDKNATNMKIVQVDTTYSSTLLFCKYTNTLESGVGIKFSDETVLKDTKDGREYKLLNSVNMPLSNEAEPKMHRFDTLNQTHYFVLEFEKIPLSGKFDLIDDATNKDAFNVYGISVNTETSKPNINVTDFIKQSLVKEYGHHMYKGDKIFHIKYKGITISLFLTFSHAYGDYHQVWINIANLTGRSILIKPTTITAKSKHKDKIVESKVLSYNTYSEKVRNRQAWEAFAVGFVASINAAQAGYSSSVTSLDVSGTANSYGYASGYAGGMYSSIGGYSSSYSTVYGRSVTRSYNGAAAYAAQQNASAIINNLAQNQYQIRDQISEGYLKTHTIPNETQYTGFVNIKYIRFNNVEIAIPINGETYTFYFSMR